MKYNRSRSRPETFWPRAVIRKWLNISNKDSESDYGADSDHDVSDAELETDGDRVLRVKDIIGGDFQIDPNEFCEGDRDLQVKDIIGEALPQSRRRKSETFRIQYINTKELRISVGTWNVGGKLPPDALDIEDWLNVSEPSDIYVIGFQEIIPLNAGNIFGAEDSRPVSKWENIIRETLNKTQPAKTKFKCYSDPASPSRFKPSDEAPVLLDEILLETDSDEEEEIYPLNEETDHFDDARDRLNCLLTKDSSGNEEAASVPFLNSKLTEALSRTERIGLSWPEPPLDLLGQCVLETSSKSYKTSKSFKTYNSFKPSVIEADNRLQLEAALLAELDLQSLIYRKRRSPYVRIVSKQMVGIFLTIWVRRSLRRHIHNVNVSTVGVGVMGYIGNKGSISVSMSIYQTFFCFICSHLTSGEKDGDAVKRNAGVYEIHRRTHFNSFSSIKLPKCIHDHERIIWMGDLNFRINLSYEKTRELISEKNWSKLVESDQLIRELRKGRSFDGWSEGTLNFAPTYKYEFNSEKYCGEDPKVGRRTPAWCDRILSSGKAMKLLSYRRIEHGLSDHRPVTASYMVEVEVFSPRKLQRALTFTDAEIQGEVTVPKVGLVGMSSSRFREDASVSGSASKLTERLKRR